MYILTVARYTDFIYCRATVMMLHFIDKPDSKKLVPKVTVLYVYCTHSTCAKPRCYMVLRGSFTTSHCWCMQLKSPGQVNTNKATTRSLVFLTFCFYCVCSLKCLLNSLLRQDRSLFWTLCMLQSYRMPSRGLKEILARSDTCSLPQSCPHEWLFLSICPVVCQPALQRTMENREGDLITHTLLFGAFLLTARKTGQTRTGQRATQSMSHFDWSSYFYQALLSYKNYLTTIIQDYSEPTQNRIPKHLSAIITSMGATNNHFYSVIILILHLSKKSSTF